MPETQPVPAEDAKIGQRSGPAAFWWAVHNLIAHPVSEILHWVGLDRWGNWLHDATIPVHDPRTGRG